MLGAQLLDASGSTPVTTVNEVAQRRDAGTFFWLDLTGASTTRVGDFAAALALTPDSGQHLSTTGQRSEFTVSHNGIRAIAYGMEGERQLTEVHVVYTAAFLVTVHFAPCPALGEAHHIYQRLRDHDQDDAPLVLFMVLDALVGSFEPVLARLDAALDEMEAAVLGGGTVPTYLQQNLEIRRILTPIMRVLGPYRNDLVGMLSEVERLPGMRPGSQQYFESHRNHVTAVFDAADDCRDESRDALQTYSSATAEQQGRVINWLTMVAAIFLPLTFVTGYFGMNFSVITHLRGWLSFTLLGLVLPVLLAICSALLLRRRIRRLGVRLLLPGLPGEGRGN